MDHSTCCSQVGGKKYSVNDYFIKNTKPKLRISKMQPQKIRQKLCQHCLYGIPKFKDKESVLLIIKRLSS